MEQNVRFSVAPLISDHAVLQRDEVIPVRGRGRAGARVRAELEPEPGWDVAGGAASVCSRRTILLAG